MSFVNRLVGRVHDASIHLVVGSVAIGAISGIVKLVSDFVLPKLGFHVICGIKLAIVSKHAFTLMVVGFSTAILVPLAVIAVAQVLMHFEIIGFGHNDY